MSRSANTAVALSALMMVGSVEAQVRLSDVLHVAGEVRAASEPVADVFIIALNLASFETHRTSSSEAGGFRLPPLPAGVYRIIAVKRGFTPAITTIVPNRPQHRIRLDLAAERNLTADERRQIWEIRRALPRDVLRELEFAAAETEPSKERRISGEMSSLTGVAADDQTHVFAQTAVGVEGTFGDGWSLRLAGRLGVMEQDTRLTAQSPVAETAGVVMELSPSDDQSYRIASVRSSWRGLDDPLIEEGRTADIESHRLEWRHEDARVEVSYLSWQNLFDAPGIESQRLEVRGESRLIDGDRGDLDIRMKVGQQDMYEHGRSFHDPVRVADVSAIGHYRPVRSVDVRYGLHTRMDQRGTMEWAPETGAVVGIGRNASVMISGLYKVVSDDATVQAFPVFVLFDEMGELLPKSRYAAGFTVGRDESSFSAVMTVTESDSLVRVVFDDSFEQFWEGVLLDVGDEQRDLTMKIRRELGRRLAMGVSTSIGRVERGDDSRFVPRQYVTGAVQSVWRPSGTSLDITYHMVEQLPGDSPALRAVDRQRLNVRMGQLVPLSPLELRVLLGIDLSRSLVLPGAHHESVTTDQRVVGGLALAF